MTQANSTMTIECRKNADVASLLSFRRDLSKACSLVYHLVPSCQTHSTLIDFKELLIDSLQNVKLPRSVSEARQPLSKLGMACVTVQITLEHHVLWFTPYVFDKDGNLKKKQIHYSCLFNISVFSCLSEPPFPISPRKGQWRCRG